MKGEVNINDFSALKEKMAVISRESPTYTKLAHYVAENYLNIIFMTAVEVADAVKISQGSVSRFCSALGYKGYNDFLSHLQLFVSGELTAPQRLQYTSSNEKAQSHSLLTIEHTNIDELPSIMDKASYKALVKRICSSKELILISARMSATLLPYVNYILNKMRPNVSMVTPETMLWETLTLKNPSDVEILAVIFPRYPNVLLKKLEELKTCGFKITAVTDSIISPVSTLAELTIEVPITRFSIFDIYSTPLLFFNLLLRDVSKELKGVKVRLDHIEQLEEQNSIYYKNIKT